MYKSLIVHSLDELEQQLFDPGLYNLWKDCSFSYRDQDMSDDQQVSSIVIVYLSSIQNTD